MSRYDIFLIGRSLWCNGLCSQVGASILGIEKNILNIQTNSNNIGILISEDESSFTISTPQFVGNKVSLALYGLPDGTLIRNRCKPGEFRKAEKLVRAPLGHFIFAHRRGLRDPYTGNAVCAVELDGEDKLVRMFSSSDPDCEGGIAVDCNGVSVAVVVSSVDEDAGNCVVLFDYATGVQTSLVCNYGVIRDAHGIRFHPDGARLFVADSTPRDRMCVFALASCSLVAQVDSINDPWAVDFATNGDVLIASRGDKCVIVMSPDLSTELRRVKASGGFSCLNDIAVGPVSGLLYALDNTNGRVVVFE